MMCSPLLLAIAGVFLVGLGIAGVLRPELLMGWGPPQEKPDDRIWIESSRIAGLAFACAGAFLVYVSVAAIGSVCR
jgi:hypothetical protein